MNLRGFILWDIEQAREVRWIEVQHDNQMPPADFGCEWIEIAGPANTTTLAVVEGERIETLRRLPPAVELDLARGDWWAAVKLFRDTCADGGCMTPLGRVDSDEKSRGKISGSVQMAMLSMQAGMPFSIDWTMSDNGVVAHDALQMIAMGVAVGEHVKNCQTAGTALRTRIDVATTLEDVQAIDVSEGFPT